jgi:multiple sugar transport system substrate-binding protein
MVLVACRGGAPAVTTTSPAATATQEAATTSATIGTTTATINFQIFGSPDELAVYQKLVDQYNTTHPGKTVNMVAVPSQDDDFTRLLAAFTAGTPPEVFLVNYRPFTQLAASNVLEPLAPYMTQAGIQENQYYEQALNAFRYNGQLTCIPQNISSLVVFYNKNLFEQYKVPLPTAGWTWQDFLGAAQALTLDTNNDSKADIYGVGIEPEMPRVTPFVWQAGGDIVDNPANPTKLTLDTPQTHEALRFFIDLRARYGVTPPENEGKSEDDVARFQEGKLGMLFFSRRVVPALRTIKNFTWDVAPLPVYDATHQPATILHSDAYCMSKVTKDKAAAWDFIQYATGPDGQKLASELGRVVPSLKSVAESPAFLDSSRPPANSKVFLDVIPSIRALPASPVWSAVEHAFNEEFEAANFANDEAAESSGEVERPGQPREISSAVRDQIEGAFNKAAEEAEEQFRKANAK